MLEINQIYFEDCLEGMSRIDDNSVDMILCDPPYGQTSPEWDKIISFAELWKQYKRIIKRNGIIAIFSAQPFTTRLIISNEKEFKYCWYWIKNQGTNFFHAKRMPIRKIEEICIFGGKIYYPQITDGHVPTNSANGISTGKAYFGTNIRKESGGKTTRYPNNILEFSCVDNYSRLHSSQKPLALFEYLIKTYTQKNETILDNCIGSGTTAIACLNTDRNYIGFENDLKYYEICQKRIENWQKSSEIDEKV